MCYISDDYLRRSGKRDKVQVTFASANDKIFGVPRYVNTINDIVSSRDINVQLNHHLVEVRGDLQEAVFNVLDAQRQPVDQVVMHYDMLHVTPPQGPMDVVAQSPLADADGWVAVDKETLQHKVYANVFGIGDCAAVPTSKTAAAAAAQFLVLRDNLDALMAGKSADVSRYDGYSSCPLVTKKVRRDGRIKPPDTSEGLMRGTLRDDGVAGLCCKQSWALPTCRSAAYYAGRA